MRFASRLRLNGRAGPVSVPFCRGGNNGRAAPRSADSLLRALQRTAMARGDDDTGPGGPRRPFHHRLRTMVFHLPGLPASQQPVGGLRPLARVHRRSGHPGRQHDAADPGRYGPGGAEDRNSKLRWAVPLIAVLLAFTGCALYALVHIVRGDDTSAAANATASANQSGHCVLAYKKADNCASSDPAVDVAAVWLADASSCTFDFSISWADGTPATVRGGPPDERGAHPRRPAPGPGGAGRVLRLRLRLSAG
jgi:hypothetical protein